MQRGEVRVRDAAPSDEPMLADVLARSFLDDPIMEWLVPDDANRYRRLLPFYRAELGVARRCGRVLTDTDVSGTALWYPPGRWRQPTIEVLRSAPRIVRSLGRRLSRGLQLIREVDAAHPREPHWYLAILGTHPDRQGRGVGAAVITAITDRCDREETPAYLESSKAENIPYYERFGFWVRSEVAVPGGPTLWTMWRDPA
ncbi:GNAT family N-acetyltransferase [Rhabdothermincola sediminis]|uniref:GNAT family N-acetyltransferase n=1 Tax=Rhabdothermincola sediminis TaxID=2751370 RepID=UPI001AA02C87|nr:GNAT family N-acetyltransferase [Rhabdothermincola sediminis]